MANYERILALAVASGFMVVIVMHKGQLAHWQRWRDKAACPPKARSAFRTVVAQYRPDVIVCEDPDRRCRKSGASLRLLRTLAQAADDEAVRSIRLPRIYAYRNRYEEAVALCDRFPEFELWRPKRWGSYERAPKDIIFFEALAFAAVVMDAPDDDCGRLRTA
ncbi:MAG: hypothetical protein RIF44_17335 [Nitratireductor sp.]